ncbi:MAG: PEP-CTERM sorting domain-containing protein [Burkholderiales bacterium]|nr:PEP-CTERM sorting domain-containing protein [Burkholderiales bacterium]MBH2017601.1 PEP-CTERM sorting domain-containing protein [Burkholderiales bacterium]
MKFNLPTPKSIGSLLLAGIGIASTWSAAHAQTAPSYTWTQVSRWQEEDRYNSGGSVVYREEWFPSKGYDVRPHQVLRTLFPGAIVGDGNNQATSNNLWAALSTSSSVIGNSTNLTRARDFMEDWDINFVAPGVSDKNYFFDWYTDNSTAYVARSAFPLTLVGGPQAGSSLLNNQNLLAMGDDNSLWLDADGTLSYYNYPTGTLEFDSSKTTFTTGPTGWMGSTVRSQLNKLIGYEEGKLYFLEGANTVQVFNYDLGHVRTDKFGFDGDLAGQSLADVIDGKVVNATYLGWDLGPVIARVTAVPEPGTVATFGIGLLGLAWVARRRTQPA